MKRMNETFPILTDAISIGRNWRMFFFSLVLFSRSTVRFTVFRILPTYNSHVSNMKTLCLLTLTLRSTYERNNGREREKEREEKKQHTQQQIQICCVRDVMNIRCFDNASVSTSNVSPEQIDQNENKELKSIVQNLNYSCILNMYRHINLYIYICVYKFDVFVRVYYMIANVCVVSDSLVKCVFLCIFIVWCDSTVDKLAPAYMNWAVFSRQDSSRCERFYRVVRERVRENEREHAQHDIQT